MNRIGAALEAVAAASIAVDLKRRKMTRDMQRAVSGALHVKQVGEVEEQLSDVLAPVFVEQLREMAAGLREMEKKSAGRKTFQETASQLIRQVFNPLDPRWHEVIVNRALPVLAVKMAEAAVAHLMALGFDIRKSKGVKQTTATQWLADHPGDLEKLEEMLADSDLPISIVTELPERMKQEIADQLAETFDKPYWEDIHKATLGDAETYLRKGLEEGWSIRRIADTMAQSFQGHTGKYAKMRATRIARTESGHALNGARKASLDGLLQDLPPEASEYIRPSWLSVLGNTTRDEHASLDGVPADDEGKWNLGGTRVPWPSHISLGPEHRCNCQCSITTEFGLGKEEADRLIAEYEERQAGLEKPEPSKPKAPKQVSPLSDLQVPKETMQQIADRQDEALLKIAKESKMNLPEWKREANRNLQQAVDDAGAYVRVDQSTLPKILKDGRVKNQFETGSSGGGIYAPDTRIRQELEVMGVQAKAKNADRPVYGYLSPEHPSVGMRKMVRSENHRNTQGYGDVVIELKNTVKDKSTVTFQDSLSSGGFSVATPAGNVSVRSIGGTMDHYDRVSEIVKGKTVDILDGYTEIQVHKGLPIDDIKKVWFRDKPSSNLQKQLSKKGLSWEMIPD